jgi:predicted transposase/invertase (TIGR01784 family)
MEELARKNPELEQTVLVIREMSREEAEQRLEEARIKQERDEAARIEYGVNVGLEQGREQGREQTARNFKALGVDPAIIAKATGLSPDEIEAL